MQEASNKPKVSVIVPVYNAEKYLDKSISSLLNQTLKDIEIIAVDDGSRDKSLEILQYIALKDARLKVIHQDNCGVSGARNKGLSVAEGEYIGFCDADDWVEPDMYEIMYVESKKNNADIAFCGIYKNDSEKEKPYLADGVYKDSKLSESVYSLLICNTDEISGKRTLSGSVCSKIFRRGLLIENRIQFLTDIHYNEDYVFCITATLYARCYCYLGSKSLYHVRRNSISATKRYYPNYWEEHKAIPDYLKTICGDSELFETQLNKYRCEIAVSAFRVEVRRLSIDTICSCLQEIRKIINDCDLQNDVDYINSTLLFKTSKAYVFSIKYHLALFALVLAYRDNRLLMKDLKP